MNRIVEVNPQQDFTLKIKYKNDKVVIFDMLPLINKGGVFHILRDYELFKKVKIGPRGRSLEWEKDLDLCADSIWTKTTGEKIF